MRIRQITIRKTESVDCWTTDGNEGRWETEEALQIKIKKEVMESF
jgi:hypothetical protein